MKKTYLETLKENIDNNYFQKEIIKDFEYEKINKKVKIGQTVGFILLSIFGILGIALFCLINTVPLKHSDVIFGISGAISILLGMMSVFIAPLCNFKVIHKNFKQYYNFDIQNKYLKLASANLENLEVLDILINENNNLTIKLKKEDKEYKIIYFPDHFECYLESDNSLVKNGKTIHNLNQLIKVYYSDLDKTTFTSLDTFTLCMEIKLKKFAKLIISDFANSIGEQ